MSNKRKQHSSSFKSKVAICAIKGDYTIPEICSKFSISPSCVHKWKKYVLENNENTKKTAPYLIPATSCYLTVSDDHYD